MTKENLLTWAEVDLKAIKHNILAIKRLSKRTEILAVVKSEAYGHGMSQVAKVLRQQGIKFFGVSDVAEGMALRQSGIRSSILLMENSLPSFARDIVHNRLTPTVCSFDLARSLNDRAKRSKIKLPVHIKVDTGMGRFGISQKEALAFVQKVSQFPHLKIEGLYTHFPVADTDCSFTQRQIKRFLTLVDQVKGAGLKVKHVHAANSMGLAAYDQKGFNLARVGLMIYGLYPDSKLKKKIKLKPALSVRSKVVFVKDIEKGQSISYGRTFIAKKRMRVATIPIGYSNGYFRSFSNKASVLIGGQRCSVLGRVTMDQIVVDVSKVKNVKLGNSVTILGKQKDTTISADDLAQFAQTINYEITCSLGPRLERIYHYV